jgi:hypothetical protein
LCWGGNLQPSDNQLSTLPLRHFCHFKIFKPTFFNISFAGFFAVADILVVDSDAAFAAVNAVTGVHALAIGHAVAGIHTLSLVHAVAGVSSVVGPSVAGFNAPVHDVTGPSVTAL